MPLPTITQANSYVTLTEGGVELRIAGANFTTNTTVKIGNTDCVITYNNGYYLYANTPILSTGTYDLSVIDPVNGTAVKANAITCFNPSQGPVPYGASANSIIPRIMPNNATVDSIYPATLKKNLLLYYPIHNTVYGISKSWVHAGETSPTNIELTGPSYFRFAETGDWYVSFYIKNNKYCYANINPSGTLNIIDNYISFDALLYSNNDIYFANVSLLLAGEGANNSTTIIDSSNNNFAITANGNACIRTEQKKYGNSSIYFDGTGDYLTLSSNTAFGFGTGDFTIECWIYYTGGNGYTCFFHNNSGSGNYINYGVNTGSKKLFVWNNANVIVTSTDISNNVWQHHAIVRKNGILYLFLNGIIIGEVSWNVDLGSTKPFSISNSTQTPNCYIDDLRVTKGVARYTDNFYVPAEYFVYTPNEYNTSTYANNDLYFANTGILLAGEGANNSNVILDSSNNHHIFTISANAIITTSEKKYGNSSIYFHGISAYIQRSIHSSFDIGANAFTLETWINVPTFTSNLPVIYDRTSSTSGISYEHLIRLEETGILFYYGKRGTNQRSIFIYYPSTFTLNTWHHLVLKRNNFGVISLYLNGVLSNLYKHSPLQSSISWSANTAGQITDTIDLGSHSIPLSIGKSNADSVHSKFYIDNYRFTLGYARYPNDFNTSLPDEWFSNETINVPANTEAQTYSINVEQLSYQIPSSQTAITTIEVLSTILKEKTMPNIYFSNTFGELITSTYNTIEYLNDFSFLPYTKESGTLNLKDINVIGNSQFDNITTNNIIVNNSMILSNSSAIIIGEQQPNNTVILLSTNDTTNTGISLENTLKSSVVDYTCYSSNVSVTNTAHTLENLTHYKCHIPQVQNINNIRYNRAFRISSTFNVSINDYGYYTNISENINNWNLYISGTASNYIRGNLGLNTPSPQNRLSLIGNQLIQANSSASALKITHTGSGNVLNIIQNENIIPSIINSKGTVVIGDSTAKTYSLPFYNSRSNYQYKLQVTSNTNNSTAVISYFGTGIESYKCPSLSFNRSGSTITNVHKLVSNPQVLGSIGFAGNDETTYLMSSGIRSELDNIASANSMPGKLIFSTTLAGTKVSADRFTISSNGNISINVVPENWKILSIRTGLTGNSNSSVIELNSEIHANVSNTYMMYMKPSVQNTNFTLTNLRYYSAAQSTYGALATIINQYAYYCGNLSSANNNYGFYSNVTGNTNYNIYSEGTAPNYFAGDIRMEKTIL